MPADTRLWLDESGRVESVRGPLDLLAHGGFPIDGSQLIQFDQQGALRTFTLGRDFALGGFLLPAGTYFWTFDKFLNNGARWLCKVPSPMTLPELELRSGETLCFDKASQQLQHVILDEPRTLGDWTLARGHIDLRPSGHVRRSQARRLGFLTRTRRG